MERHLEFSEDEFYHVYNRGVEKRDIFLDATDYARMELLLFLSNSSTPVNIGAYLKRGFTYESLWGLDIDKPIVEIGAWCLMPNHFHLVLQEIREGGISLFMQKLTTAYTMYFNKREERVGPLMQGTFKAEHLHSDTHFQYIFSYVHLNPVKLIPGERNWKERGIQDTNNATKFLRAYPHSSLNDYMRPDSRIHKQLINPSAFPWKFESIGKMRSELEDWLSVNSK